MKYILLLLVIFIAAISYGESIDIRIQKMLKGIEYTYYYIAFINHSDSIYCINSDMEFNRFTFENDTVTPG